MAAENIDPGNNGRQYAWGENVGWLNAEPGGEGGEGLEVTDTEITGWIWGENIGWVSFSCENTSSCGSVEYHVTNDGCGHLAGSAWAENVGWISLSHSLGGVTIDPTTGEFRGNAWAENVGWVRFRSEGTVEYGVRTAWRRSPPAGVATLTLTHEDPDTTLTWTAITDASVYDVVEGDLGALHATGDFTSATSRCTADDHGTTSLTHATTPGAGDGFWFLVRGANCGGNGSYDTGGSAQSGSRDADINAAPGACS